MENTQRTPSVFAARGTLFHRFVHRAARQMWKSGEQIFPVDMGMDLMTQIACQHDVPSEEVVPITMEHLKWLRVLAVKWCEATRLDARKTLAAEERFFADLLLPTGETVQVTGQLDLLLADPPDGVIVIDYKSGNRRPKQPRNLEKAEKEGTGLTALGWAQWLIYSYLMFENFPSIDRVIFREVHVLWGEERQARMERWEMERLKDVLASQVAMLHQAVKEGPESPRWTASAGPHCSLCPRPHDCPIKDEVGIPMNHAEAQKMAQDWIVTGARRDSLRKLLYGAVDAWGPLEVPHAEGRRVVGWDVSEDGKRNFGMFEPKEDYNPYDEKMVEAVREAGALAA